MKKTMLFIMLIMLFTTAYSVSAAVPTITWISPSNGATLYDNFTISASTNINANCTYNITYSATNTTVLNGTFTIGENNTIHNQSINYSSLSHANNYNIIVACYDSNNVSDINSSFITFIADPICGDNLINSWSLGHDLSGCSSGIIMNTSGVTLDCAGHSITGTSSGILITNDDLIINNCSLNGFSEGLTMNSPYDNVTLTNSEIKPSNGGIAVNVQQASNFTLTNNLFNLTNDAIGLNVDRWNTATIYHNNFLPATNYYSLLDKGGNFNINLNNNYWGHSSCSLYSYGVDSNSTTIIDNTPVSQQNNWSSTINCSDQSIFEGFINATVYAGDGSTTLSDLQGYVYTYNDSNERQNISDIININGVYPWRIYSTYYYPGDQIVFDVNISPANYKFIQFGIEGSSFQSYNLTVTNLTGMNNTKGVYKVNISNYVFNSSNSNINGSSTPRVMNFFFRTTDNLGATRLLWINALYNFTVQDVVSTLGGNTTNWSSISDMSNVSSLTFDLPGKGKIVFTSNVDLTDPDFISDLANLGTLIQLSNGTIGLDSQALAALNVSANITFYNVSGLTDLNISGLNSSYLLSKLKMDGSICDPSVCVASNYDNTTDSFTVSIAHWTTYSLDMTAPVISGASPTGTLSSSTTTATLQVTTDEIATCKYDASDVSYLNMTNNFTTSDGTTHNSSVSVSSGTSYTYYVRCKDLLNNTNGASTTISFSVATVSTSSSGGGGSFNVGTYLTTNPQRVALSKFGVYYFRVKGDTETHTMKIKTLTEDGVSLSIASNPQTVNLKVEETKLVDVSGDGKADLTLLLESVSSSSAYIKVSQADGSIVEKEVETTDVVVSKTDELDSTTQEITQDTVKDTVKDTVQDTVQETMDKDSDELTDSIVEPESSNWWIWVLLVLGIIIYFAMRKKK